MSLPQDRDQFADERELRADVHAAVERALNRTLEGRDRKGTNVELEKLAFLVIDEFDLELTYSWYIAGACTATGRSSTDRQGPDGPSGPSLTDDRTRVDFGDVTAEIDDDRTQKFTNYLASETLFDDYELRDVWYTGRHEFLSDFYEACAPERYTDAYLAATEIRRHLKALADDDQTNNRSLLEYTSGEQPLLDDETEEAFRLSVSDLHLALARDDDLSETTAVVTEGTDLIERTLDRLTRVEPTAGEERDLIEELSEFFFFYVWRLPALVISIQTATGPNAGELRVREARELDGFPETVRRRRDDLAEHLHDARLLPTLEEDKGSDIGLSYEMSLTED
ncbi:hypothetical protein [Halobaculum sp. MBLA0143]|uniref:hypothetical protein n=1 Tax=Halobaculum sp. MBLA0143 TaxID=3079933 RepID=UPI0035249F69